MDLSDIISDAIVYPFHNLPSLAIFIIIGIVGGVLGGASILGALASYSGHNILASSGFGIIGIIIGLLAYLLISGYTLDVVKYGIERRNDGPGLDIVRQITNAVKILIVCIVYYLIPTILSALLRFLLGNGILTTIIIFIIVVVFAFAQFMAICRLAKYDSLGEALAIGEAIGDISKVGMLKVLATVLIVLIIGIIIATIIALIINFNDIIGGILLGIFGVYFVFFYNRAVGLLYSQV